MASILPYFQSENERFWTLLPYGLRAYPQAPYITTLLGSKIPRQTIEAMYRLGFWVDPEKINRFMEKLQILDIRLEAYQDEEFTPLHLAAIVGRAQDIEPATHFFNVDSLDRKGRSALHLAAFFGHLEVAMNLVKAGAHHDLGTPGNGTPKDFAIKGNEPALVEFFLSVTKYAQLQSKFTVYQESVIKGTPTHFPRDSKDFSEYAAALFGIKHARKVDATEIFEKAIGHCQNPELFKSYYKIETLLRRVYHAWKIDWNPAWKGNELIYKQKIFFQYNDLLLSPTPVGGGYSAHFIRKMEKTTRQFKEFLPMLPRTFSNCLELLEETLHVSDPKNSATATDLLERWRNNKPIAVPIYFARHVSLAFLWGRFFILCNRGQATRKPIEVFFCKKPLQTSILSRLISGFGSDKESENEYKKYMFGELPELLGFTHGTIEEDLEKMWKLPLQSIGNCAWESVETAVFALMMLHRLRRNRLIGLRTYSMPVVESLCRNQRKFFDNWLLFHKVVILEKYLKRLDEKPQVMTNRDMLPELKKQFTDLLPQDWIHPKLRAKMREITFPRAFC